MMTSILRQIKFWKNAINEACIFQVSVEVILKVIYQVSVCANLLFYDKLVLIGLIIVVNYFVISSS